MTYQEKAQELIEKFKKQFITVEGCNDGGNPCIVRTKMFHNSAKQCAIIAVDGIIEALNAFGYVGAMYDDFETGDKVFTTDKDPTEFWQQVKNELTK